MVANLAKENQTLKAENKALRPVMVVGNNGKIKQATKVTPEERQHRILHLGYIAALSKKGMFAKLKNNAHKLTRYIDACEDANKIDALITIEHFK